MSELNGPVSLAISTCPNDTFIFDAWVNGKLKGKYPPVNCTLCDISRLNRMAMNRTPDVVKVSFFAFGMIRQSYILLNSGGAMGRGCGPVVVARSEDLLAERKDSGFSVAVPGPFTTANLLFSLYRPDIEDKSFLRFDRIMPAVARGEVDAGVVIHEGRFTVERYGLKVVEDLGAWWEDKTGLLIPLGAIVVRKELGSSMISEIESTVRESLEFALENQDSGREFIRKHAGEMDDDVIKQHISLYVNRYCLDFGEEGRESIRVLLEQAERSGLFGMQK